MDSAMTSPGYSLKEGYAIVSGACRAAVYSFKSGRVFPLNAAESKALSAGLSGQPSAEDRACCERFVSFGIMRNGLAQDDEIPPPPPRLRYVWLELTARCNCRCIHCYGAFGQPCAEQRPQELAEGEWIAALHEIRKLGCNAIQLIGGEPILSPAFGMVLQEASTIGFGTIDVFTNGTLVTPQIAANLKRFGASVRLSVYGFDPASHSAITGNPKSFELMDRGIDALLEAGVPVRPAIILMRENQDLLPLLKDYLKRKGLRYAGFDAVRTHAHDISRAHCVTSPTLLAQRYVSPERLRTSFSSFAVNRRWNSCWYGKFALASNGDVFPCIFARDQICGNIRSSSHAEIRDNLIRLWSITKDSVEVCSQCEFRYACDDCRPLALAENGTLQSKYPRCSYSPVDGRWN